MWKSNASQYLGTCSSSYRSMKARVVMNGRLSDEITIDNEVKQGDVLGPNTTLDILFCDTDS